MTKYQAELTPQNVEPTECGECDFDWDTVYQHLDGHCEGGCPKALTAFSMLLNAIMDVSRLDRKVIGLRVIALAWVLNPANVRGSPSLVRLARRCGVTRNYMAMLTGEMSRLARWRNRAQQHAWNWRQKASPPTGNPPKP
ncbi:MAG: hypothetical protein HS113_29215 [Verrucomicrobiales bacterium]|nr:hypothetical protein [Verrucomicrobiales bacterium]